MPGQMDVPRVLERLRSFVAAATLGPRPASPPGIVDFRDTRRPVAVPDELVKEAALIEVIFERVLGPDWREHGKPDTTGRWQHHRRAALRAIAQLESLKDVRGVLGDDAPTLSAGRFHPWAWDGARSMWQSGHYRQSVVDALIKVQAETQKKTGRHDLSETDLFRQVFTTDAPKPGAPRLRRRADDGNDTYRSVQRGAMALAEGLFAGIRNVAAHTVAETEADEQVALEQLAAVSVFARWVQDAELVTA